MIKFQQMIKIETTETKQDLYLQLFMFAQKDDVSDFRKSTNNTPKALKLTPVSSQCCVQTMKYYFG